MDVRGRDQDANERTWIVINCLSLCVLDFAHVGGLPSATTNRAVGDYRILKCKSTYMVKVVRGKDATECPKGDFTFRW